MVIDARLAAENLAAHDLRFQCEADFLDRVGIRAAFRADSKLGKYPLPDTVYRLGTSSLLLELERRAQILLGESGNALNQRLVFGRLFPVP